MLWLVSACTEKKEEPGSNPLSAPADYVGALNQAQKKAVSVVNAAPLEQTIQAFHAAEGRYPKNLDELVAEGYVASLPEAPKGMKFSYDAASGELKVVKQ